MEKTCSWDDLDAGNGVLTKDVPSGIYNMGDDEALLTNELIE